jgi:hypothetical protein
MSVDGFLAAIESSGLGTYMREAPFGFVPVEIVHVLALTLVFGSIAMIDLRLIGLASLRQPVSTLTRDLLPITWVAFAMAVLSGSMMFMAKASNYFYAFEFRMKILLIILAGVNMIAFHRGPFRSIQSWDTQVPPPGQVRMFGLVSILLWVGVIFLGRFIGFAFEMAPTR